MGILEPAGEDRGSRTRALLQAGRRRGRPAWPGEVAWSAVVVCCATAPLLALLGTGHAIAWFDSARLFSPLRALVSDALRSARLPLWNPHEGTGMPLFAQGIHGVLHPWSLLAAVLAPGDGVDLMIVLHVATGALGAGVLARTLRVSRSAAVVAGIGYGLSGYLLSMARVLTFLAGAGAAPWVIAGLAGVISGGRWRLPLAAVAVAVLHLAGDPQWTLLATAMGVLLAWEAGGWRGARTSVLAVLVGTLAASVQLVPSWTFYQQSARSLGLEDLDLRQWALAPWRAVEFVAAGFFAGRPGSLEAPVFQWLAGTTRYSLPFVYSVAVGAPVLWLACVGSAAGRTGRVLAVVALVLLWLALGHHLGASDVTAWIPVWSRFRYSEKLVGPLTLTLVLLAAIGTDSLARSYGKSTVRVVGLCAAAAAAIAVVAAILASASPPVAAPDQAWRLAGERLGSGLAQAALGLLAIAALLWAARRSERWRPWIAPALAGVVLVHGLQAARYALHPGRAGVRDAAPLGPLRQVEAVPRVMTPLDAGLLWTPAGLDEVDGALFVQSRMGVAPYAAPSRIDHISTYSGIEPGRATALFRDLLALGPGQLVALRRFAVTHAVVPINTAPEDEPVRAAAISGGRRVGFDPRARFEVWALPHRPWASFAGSVRSVSSEAEARAAVVELERAGDPAVALLGPAPRALSIGVVLEVEREPDSLRVVADAPGDGLLVLNDAEWTGWEATIDGSRVEIHLADGLVRAVRWPAGRHVLEMRYRPVELRIGLASSGAGVLLVLLLGLVRRPPGSTAAGSTEVERRI